MNVSPLVILGAFGVAVLGIAAYQNRDLESEPAVIARADTAVDRRQAATSRELDRIDAKKASLDDRFMRLRERQAEAEAKAETWRTRAQTGHKGARDKASRAEATARRLDREAAHISTLQDGLEAKYIKASAGLKVRRNPSETSQLEKAKAASMRFHGTPNEVIELSPDEQKVSKYLVVLGPQPELDYQPDSHSERTGSIWEHQTGDRGDFLPKGPGQAILAWDLQHRRPVTVLVDSDMQFDTSRGLVG